MVSTHGKWVENKWSKIKVVDVACLINRLQFVYVK